MPRYADFARNDGIAVPGGAKKRQRCRTPYKRISYGSWERPASEGGPYKSNSRKDAGRCGRQGAALQMKKKAA